MNSISDNSISARVNTEAKPKSKPNEAAESQTDFSAYVFALAQPARPDLGAPNVPRMQEPASTPDSALPQNTSAPQFSESAQNQQAQKVGHEPALERSENNVTTTNDKREGREAADIKPSKAHAAHLEKDFLEALGISTSKTSVRVKNVVQNAVRTNTEQHILTKELSKTETRKAGKSQIVTDTLSQLQKAPEMVLMNTEGLKRLSEKLGLGFLGKVSEKITEKNIKLESTQAGVRQDLRTETIGAVTVAKVQKAGDGANEQNTGTQNQGRFHKNLQSKTVSRETITADAAEKPAILNGTDLKPVTLPESILTRSQPAIMGDIRLSDVTVSIRHSETIRAAVENPSLRADMLRQFSEVMTRAQVLVTDSQNAQFSVKLYPRELGRMEIDLKLVDGEIRGKIVVESEDVKNEMQNFLQNRENNQTAEQIDLNRIDIEVRNGNQNAGNSEKAPDASTLLQNLVTRAATSIYEAADSNHTQGAALYA